MIRTYQVTVAIECDTETIREGKAMAQSAIEAIGLECSGVKCIPDMRTLQQNKALHVEFELIEEHCTERGLTVDMLILHPTEFPITRHLIKDFFREIGRVLFGRESTADLEKHEFQKTQETFEREIARRLDYTAPFPSINKDL